MVITFQQMLHPFLIMCFIIGLDFYPRKQSILRWTLNLSILYSLALWFVYAYILYYIIIIFTIRVLFYNTFIIITVEINVLTSIVSTIMSHYHRKRFAMCLKKLASVDDTLEKLGTPKIYQKIHVWSKRLVIGWLIYILLINIYDSIWWLKITGRLYISYILNYPVYINTLMDLLFISILWYIGTRFDKINEYMRDLVREEHGLRWKKPVVVLHQYTLCTDNCKRTLWILIHLHLELCRIARELNLIFGIQMILEMTSCFLYLTGLCYHLYLLTTRESDQISTYEWFSMSIWVPLFLLKVYSINYVCESVSLKANKISKMIHELSSILRYANVWKEIRQFTLQTMYHQLKFTGIGFPLGDSFLRKLCMTVVTFIIIMRQMEM